MLEIRRQLAFEFHRPAVRRVPEGEPGGMQEWAIEVRDGAEVAGHPPAR